MLCDAVMAVAGVIPLFKLMGCATLKVNCGLWAIIMDQCKFTNNNKCTAPVRDVCRDKGCVCVRIEIVKDTSEPASYFATRD